MVDVWPIVHAERAALLSDLEQLDDPQWEQASLCEGWSVHDVAAHLVDVALTTRVGFLVGLARARFDFDRQNTRGVARHRGPTPRHTLARLRATTHRTSTPPAALGSRVVEEVVHGEDIRRPLGVLRDYPTEALRLALDYQAGTPAGLGGGRERVRGLRLEATDEQWVTGGGAPVHGTMLDLLLAASGRRVALARLTGAGVVLLGQRP